MYTVKLMKIFGTVIKGKREGTKIGFPTANLKTEKAVEPGIYAGYVNLTAESLIDQKAIFYVSEDDSRIVECHILDFPKRDLYESEISVEILYKLRDVQEFASLKAASEQIKKDELIARKWFKNNPNDAVIDIIRE